MTSSAGGVSAPAGRLRAEAAAVRVSFTWLGVRKALTPQQKSEAAESFGAEGDCLSAAKKLLDTRHPAYRSVTAVRGRIVSYWRGMTLPYPEPGVRLIRQDDVAGFDRRMNAMRKKLTEAVAELERRYDQLRSAARDRLGRLYDPRDYPPGLKDLFAVAWDFPATEPPEYLLRLKPELYEQERARVAARFEEAVKLAELAFTAELSELVEHCSEQLDELVERARRVVSGVDPQELRDSRPLRRRVHEQLASVRQALDGLLVDKPRRRILRSPAGAGASGEGEAA